MRKQGYISDVDRLIEETTPEQVLSHFGMELPNRSSGEYRMPCVFDASCNEGSYGTLTINLSDSANRIYCHSCGTRGNLLTLIHGLQHGRPPTSGRLRGDEFKQALETLRGISGGEVAAAAKPAVATASERATEDSEARLPNVPLKDSENDRARDLVTLHEKGTTDPAQMNPAAARYFRERRFLTPDVCDKWKVAYLPGNVGGTLRSRIAYAIESERSDVLAWVGRDPDYDAKRQRWIKSGRTGKEPMKHRFPSQKMFRKGLELYGQQAARLKEDGYHDAIANIGIIVVEGMNDVIRLDTLRQPAVGAMSNRMTDPQVDKVVRWARRLAAGKVTLMFDNDERGSDGAKDALWKLHQCEGIQPRLAWSREMFDGAFDNRQPESLNSEEWTMIRNRLG